MSSKMTRISSIEVFAPVVNGHSHSFEERFDHLTAYAGGQIKAAELCGVHRGTMAAWAKSDGKIPLSAALILVKKAGLSLDWLATGFHQRPDLDRGLLNNDLDVERIPILAASALSIPEKAERDPDIGNSFPMSKALLVSLGVEVENIRFIKLRDDGMEPALLDGSVVLIDTSYTVFDRDAIYALFQPGEIRLKRLSRSVDGSIIISSDNQSYPKERLSAGDAEALNIAGRVIWSERRF